jgi:MoxR-like ATPase
MEQPQSFDSPQLDVSHVQSANFQVKQQLAQVVIGQHDTIDFLLVALFTGGHILLEGVPGVAKTLTAKLLAKSISSGFSRIQFTPDLMPADVMGTSVFNLKTSEFSFKSGPIFSNIVLIDEINRAPAKTQAALFEVMAEKQVTVDGMTHKMSKPFFVMATQNPIEQEGTYKLPEAQLDRFLFKITVNYPDLEGEKAILRRFSNDFDQKIAESVKAVLKPSDIETCRSIIERVYIREELLDYIAAIVENTRHNGDLFLGASPRASLAILKSSKAMAAMSGRAFVTPDDIRSVAYPVLNHRIILTPDREMEGMTTREVIDDILRKIDVPR